MRRLLTAVVGIPIILAALFYLPPRGFYAFVVLLLVPAAIEFARIARNWVPTWIVWLVPVLAPVLAIAIAPEIVGLASFQAQAAAVAFVAVAAGGAATLLSGAEPERAPAAVGILAFGLPYFGLPMASLCMLQAGDRWLCLTLLALLWVGDSAAYYVGSALGRHKLAPIVSPKKTWEGAIGGFAGSLVVVAAISVWRFGEVRPEVIALAAATAFAGQVGDLVESLFKRGSKVKDSGSVLPGHGGFLDRFDSLLFAAPVWWLGLLWLGYLPGMVD